MIKDSVPAIYTNKDIQNSPITQPGPRQLELRELIAYDAMCQRAAGCSEATIALTAFALGKLADFQERQGLSTLADEVTPDNIRAFTVDLNNSQRFASHPYTKRQLTMLAPASINGYLRAIRAAFNRWEKDQMIGRSPFAGVKIPPPHYKNREALSEGELKALLLAINTKTATGFRDYTLIHTFLDTFCRVKELTSLTLENVNLEQGLFKVYGKGGKERTVIVGAFTSKLLWKYVKRYRPEPALPMLSNLFLTEAGMPLTKNRVEAILKRYARKVGIDQRRVCPHVLRHTGCTMWVRNNGDLRLLQELTGHSSISTLSIYLHPTPADLRVAHRRYSPVDNMYSSPGSRGR